MKVFVEMVYPLRCLTVLQGLSKISGFFVLSANETVNRLAKFQGKVTNRLVLHLILLWPFKFSFFSLVFFFFFFFMNLFLLTYI